MFSDADFVGDLDTRKSATTWLLVGRARNKALLHNQLPKLKTRIVLCSSRMHMDSTTATRLKRTQNEASVVYEDSQAAIKISENPINHPKPKHIATKYHFTREQLESGQIALEFCPTEQMIADIMTKPLGRCRSETLRRGLGLTAEPCA